MTHPDKPSMASLGLKQVRRVVIFVLGMSVVLFGVALLVLPGPAVVVIPAGLAILAIEFRWARNWLRRARVVVKGTGARMGRGKTPLQLWREWRSRREQRRLARKGNAAPAHPDPGLSPVSRSGSPEALREPVER
ncbi:MAG: PGPGW domain-containing protein [Verrucomicrobiales bacterium]|nr:PGPGW domain-containing protein [Verrucomicrobiales bacterium]